MKNKHLIGRNVLHIIILLLFLTVSRNINAQPHYFQKYEGIPIIAHTNLTTTELVNRPASLSKMKELGIYGFYAVDLNPQRYNIITNNYDLKVFPYQFRTDTTNIIPYPHITRYTNAVYSIWLAGGRGNGELGDIQIDYNPDLADRTIDGTGIETKNNGVPGHLFDGPYYFQWRKQKVYDGIIRYNADFRMKIDSIDTLPAGYRDDLVCSLQVVASRFVEDIPGDPLIQYDTTLHYKLVYVRDFENPSTDSLWGNWTKQSIEDYTLMAVNQSREGFYVEDVESTGSDFTASFMQYKVYWTGLQYLKLTIDTINIYDNDGWELFNSQIAIDNINGSLNYYNDTNYVLGWHGIGEPGSIDNYLCFRRVNEIIHQNYPAIDVFTSVTTGGKGRFHWLDIPKGVNVDTIHPGIEFFKRTGLKYLSINLYNYHYPYVSPACNDCGDFTKDPDYLDKNIEYVTDYSLGKLNAANVTIPISYSSQSGQFFKWVTHKGFPCVNTMANHIYPTFEQMNYHINLGLLFGAKELTIDPAFTINTICGNIPRFYRDGLIDYEIEPCTLNVHGVLFRDIIKPRLSGLFGKTLKRIQQEIQFPKISTNVGGVNINHQKISYIHSLPFDNQNCVADIGIFTNIENQSVDYFMILNRYYSARNTFFIGFQNLTGFNNWTLLNHNDTTSVSFIKDVNGCAEIADVIPQGDGILYGLAPTILLGGELNANESISGTNTLLGELKIKRNKTLTVNGTYNCYKNIIVNSGGKLVVAPGATLNFYDGAKLVVNGSLIANGTSNNKTNFNFQSINDSLQNGLYLNSYSIDTLVYCVIQNGYFGIKVSSSEPFINYCEIKNCIDGIYFYDSHYQPDTDEGTRVYNSQIHSNNSSGINLLEASPLLIGNSITGNYVGIKCLDNSYPFLGKLYDFGLNLVTGQNAALESDASSPVLGIDELSVGGLNSVYNTYGEYDVIASNDSYISAQYCWWGEYEPERDDFNIEKSTFIYDPPLDYDPLPTNSPIRIIDPYVQQTDGHINSDDLTITNHVENNPTKKYNQALQKYFSGQFVAARNICRSIIHTSPDSSISYSALRLIKNMIRNESEKDSLKGFLQSNLLNAQQREFNVYAKVMLADLHKNNYINALDGIMNWYPSTEKKPYVMFKKFLYYLNDVEDKESALNISNQMTMAYPLHILTREAKHLIGQLPRMTKEKSETVMKPNNYELTQNYPNPFNPVTTIKYGIKERTDVRIDVFDILGRKITTLVNDPKDAGNYEVVFDASKLSSGVYIYRLTTKDFTASRKMMVVK